MRAWTKTNSSFKKKKQVFSHVIITFEWRCFAVEMTLYLLRYVIDGCFMFLDNNQCADIFANYTALSLKFPLIW